jgi:hypothetical protein
MNKRPANRWFRISIRTLLLVITVFGCGLGWVMNERAKIANAINYFKRRNAHVVVGTSHAEEWQQKKQRRESRSTIARLLFGETWLGDIGYIGFPWDAKKDFTDDDMAIVAAFPNLQFLDLTGTKVTGRGLVHLHRLQHLKKLDLTWTKIGDEGMQHVRGLKHLRVLCLTGTQVGDDGLEHVNGLQELNTLILEGTLIADQGLSQLDDLPKLKSLNLDNTKVTDAGIEHLRRFSNLDFIALTNTRVTPKGKDSLRKALPNCDIP